MSELDKDWAVIEAWEHEGDLASMQAASERSADRWPAAVRALIRMRDIIGDRCYCDSWSESCELCQARGILAEVDRKEEP